MFKEKLTSINEISLLSIGVDADSIHSRIKEILFKTSESKGIKIVFVSDRPLKDVQSVRDKYKLKVSNVVVKTGENSADNWIYEHSDEFFLVVTHDIPLSERVIDKGVLVIDERGNKLNKDNIREALSIRNVMNTMRDYNLYEKKGRNPIRDKDVKKFSDSLNEIVTKYLNQTNNIN